MPPKTLKPNLSLPSFNLRLGRGRGNGLVGLDIQPGYVAAVQAHVNGGITVQHAAGAPLPPDALREGEVLDERTLSDALRELFDDGRLGKRVRIGLANQRTVLRTLELPPVTDRKELAAAVRFQAEDQVPMPLASAVLDFHSLGVFDTPNGPRQRVIVVAAQREMVERLLRSVRHAGLRPEGVDLSAFALIRSLYRPATSGADGESGERVLYLNVGGLTNMAIAEGTLCRFTRVVGGGLEAMAVEIAERRGIPLIDARALLAAYDLKSPRFATPVEPVPAARAPEYREDYTTASADADVAVTSADVADPAIGGTDGATAAFANADVVTSVDVAASEPLVDFHPGFEAPPEPPAVETWALAQDPSGVPSEAESPLAEPPSAVPSQAEPVSPSQAESAAPLQAEPVAPDQLQTVSMQSASAPVAAADADIRMVLENGIREIVGEVRNSLDFHRSQDGGGEVTSVILSGPALELSGFTEALEADLGLAVHRQSVSGVDGGAFAAISEHRLAIATGLAAEEAPR